MADKKKKDEELLKRIKERYSYAYDAWKDIKSEGAIDMLYISGDPWDPADKKDRKDAGRPALAPDELGQYINQSINNIRQNQRGIKVNPAGNGATEKTAELHQDLIRGIEYRSNAQRNAYTPAFENSLQRSYGFFRISREYVPGKFDQEIKIKGITNPDSVLYDPDVSEPDWSDANFCFVLEPMKKEAFKRKYPKAEVKDFSSMDMESAPDWIKDDDVMVAEYWEAEVKTRKMLQVQDPTAGPTIVYQDEMEEGDKREVLKERTEETREVSKYITNGIEILERTEQPGPYIPIVPVIGKEIFLTIGGRVKRVIMSLIRLARDPFMMYCYLCSQEAEEAAMTPKAPVMGYKGQFESDADAWKTMTKVPYAYLQVDPIVDAGSGSVLPLPTRPQFTPNFQAYEIAKDSWRRSIQAAMGISPLPTAAQRNNEKSGIALEKIQTQESVGSFHFTDNFDRALEYAGRIIEKWLPVVYDTEREVGVRKADGTHSMVKINTPQPYTDQKDPMVAQHYPLVGQDGEPNGEHDVTISTGASFQSQREAAADFADSLLKNLAGLPIPPAQQAQLLALAIQLRDLGPLGDQMVQIVKGDPNNAAAQGQQAIAHLQQAQQVIQQLQQELQKLQLEKAGKTMAAQQEIQIEQLKSQTLVALEKLKLETQITIAEINTKAQQSQVRMKLENDMYKQIHGDAHEAQLQANDQAHEVGMQAQDQAHAADMQDAQHLAAQQAQQQQPQGDQPQA